MKFSLDDFKDGNNLLTILDVIELRYIVLALLEAKHNRAHAADLLGIRRATLVGKMKKHGIYKPKR